MRRLGWWSGALLVLGAVSIPAAAVEPPLSPDDRYLWRVPPAANAAQQGFIRLTNRGAVSGNVEVWGLDAAGLRSPGTVALTLAPHESRQMNSQDLEFGNPGKGLSGALGSGSGDWTLVVRSDLDLEALAYLRTPEGFLTSMHDRVGGDGSRWWVPVFNPAENPNQVSRLRIVNTDQAAVALEITGIDDSGAPGAGPVSLSLAALRSIELGALDLENGNPALGLSGGLGNGAGKWQLWVASSGRISVQSLLFDPTGHQTNLSALPDPVEAAPGQRTIWFVPAASNAQQQGFVRLLNRDSRAGQVMLWGIDDAGQRSAGTIELTLSANESRQLNSQDLESGNPAKGIAGALGSGTGNWRLAVLSDLDLVPMAFIRTPDGFLTSIHDTVAGDGLEVRVPIFNPGENLDQVSLLRLANPNARPARVSLAGTDDAGQPAPGGSVALELPAGTAIMLSAQNLEQGNPGKGLSGALGDGQGKWTLRVTSTLPIELLSLLNDPRGFLTNLSTATQGGSAALDPQPAPPPDPQFLASAPTPFVAGCDGVTPVGVAFANAEVEPYLAANPTDLRNLVGAWQQDRWSNGGARGIVAAASFDGGRTWSRRAMPFSRCGGGNAGNGADFERASDPWVSFAPDGTLHQMALAFSGQPLQAGSSSAMLVNRSLDGGLTWSAPIALIRDGAQFFNDKNALTADPTDSRRVYAVWDRLVAGGGGPAYFARSTDGGQSWEPARPIYDPGADSQTVGNLIAVLSDGALVNLFTRIDTAEDGSSSASLAVIRSLDQGRTWSAPVPIADLLAVGVRDPETGARVRDGSILAQIAAGAEGSLAVVWQDARFSGGVRDGIALSRSIDGGLTWSAPVRVNAVPAVQAFTPSANIRADGTIAVTYYDLRSNTADPATLPTDHWLARSRDGLAWSESHVAGPFDLRTAPNAGGLFLGDYQALVGLGELLVPFFVRANDGDFGNRTDVFIAPARALLGTVAPLASAAAPAAAATKGRLSPEQAQVLGLRVHENIVRAMEDRVPGWSRIGLRRRAQPEPRSVAPHRRRPGHWAGRL